MHMQNFRGPTRAQALRAVKRALGEEAIIHEVRRLRGGHIEIIASKPEIGSGLPADFAVAEGAYQWQKSQTTSSLADLLQANGMTVEAAARICSAYSSLSMKGTGSIDIDALCEALSQNLAIGWATSRILAIVGPTGVGKTTTTLKCALSSVLFEGESAAIISLDADSFGAAAKVSHFAQLTDIPAASAHSAEELRAAVEGFSEFDRIFIDTTGCSPYDAKLLSALDSQLSSFPEAERLLLLPASANAVDMRAAISEFSRLNLQWVGISKTDETRSFGPCCSVLIEAGIPLSLVTNGRRIPEDLHPAEPEILVELLTRTVH